MGLGIGIVMTTQSTHQIIAIPYYGTLRQPKLGLAQIYFIAKVNLSEGCLEELSMAVWNPKAEPQFGRWLHQLGVHGILCSDDPYTPDPELTARQVWVHGGLQGDVEVMLSQWLNTAVKHRPLPGRSAGSSQVKTIKLAPLYEGIDL